MDSEGTLTIGDTWSTGYSVPTPDIDRGGTDDVLAPSGMQNSTHTTLSWTRLLVTGDSNDIAITDTSLTLMWGFGTTDGINLTDYDIHPEGDYGCTTVDFLTPCSESSVISEISFFTYKLCIL